jgi:hypothetical protein
MKFRKSVRKQPRTNPHQAENAMESKTPELADLLSIA